MTIRPITTSFILLAASFSFTVIYNVNAEIEEISAEEMTETHIRDTTVILRKQPNQEAQQRPDLIPLSDSYLSEQRERSLIQQQSNANLKPYDASQIERERNLERIWKEFNIQDDIPKDYGNLTFPSNIDPSGSNIPAGTDYSIGKHNFSISIPNTNSYQPNTHRTPNGEYQINITEDKIQFIMNLPQNK